MILGSPQKMLLGHPSGPMHSRVIVPFTPSVRRFDDRKTQFLDGSLVGSLPILGGGLAAERSASAWRTQGRPSISRCEDLDTSGQRRRGPLRRRHDRAVVLQARQKDDPVRALQRTVRKDCGKVSLAPALTLHLLGQYQNHPHWSYQLHYDNLAAAVKADPALGRLRSYATVRRYMQAHGMVRKPRPASDRRPGEARAEQRREEREIRSYEAEYVGSLWHLDFHHGSLKVLTSRGQWQRPIALGILDDHSRLCCHLQWYLSETAEDLVHGLSQAIQKRGLPRRC